MVLHSQQVTVGEKPIELYPVDLDGVELTITAEKGIFVGDAHLTESSAFLLKAGTVMCLSLGPGEHLFAFSKGGDVTAYVLATKNA
jgi:hypothetical protein